MPASTAAEFEAAWRRIIKARWRYRFGFAALILAVCSINEFRGASPLTLLIPFAVAIGGVFFGVTSTTLPIRCPHCGDYFFARRRGEGGAYGACVHCGVKIGWIPPNLLHKRLHALAGGRPVEAVTDHAVESNVRGVRVVIEQPARAAKTFIDADATQLRAHDLEALRTRIATRAKGARVTHVGAKVRVALPQTEPDPQLVGEVMDDLADACALPAARPYR